jgi:glycosyl transferase family 25
MERIDKFAYINLTKRTDRKEHILKELKRFDIPDEKIIRIEAVESDKGAYGCALSHQKALEAFKESGDNIWCILEDDHYFPRTKVDTNRVINIFLDNVNYDVFLGCYCALRGSDLGDNIFRRATSSSMASFYITKRNVCDALIASHKQSARTLHPSLGKKTGTPCDFMWDNLMKVFVFVAPYTPYGSQVLNHSNIRNKKMDYSTYVGLKVDREL